jgi:hypothetical protein
VASKEDVKLATDDLAIMARLKKTLEEKRKEYVDPINAHLKGINNAFKAFMGPLEMADKITREKVKAFWDEEQRRQDEVKRINQLRIEAAELEAKLKGTTADTPVLVPVPPAVKEAVTDIGEASVAHIRKWELVDITQVPAEYLQVNAALVGKVVRAGIPAIPGIRIWTEEILRITPNTIKDEEI